MLKAIITQIGTEHVKIPGVNQNRSGISKCAHKITMGLSMGLGF